MLYFNTTSDGIVFKVHVQPKAAKNQISGVYDDAVKVRLTAPPVDNAANKMCIKFLAKQLGISKAEMEIVAGHTSRSKQIRIRLPDDIPAADAADRLKKTIYTLVSQKGS